MFRLVTRHSIRLMVDWKVFIYANFQHYVHMFLQISRIPDLIQKFWAKKCGLSSVFTVFVKSADAKQQKTRQCHWWKCTALLFNAMWNTFQDLSKACSRVKTEIEFVTFCQKKLYFTTSIQLTYWWIFIISRHDLQTTVSFNISLHTWLCTRTL